MKAGDPVDLDDLRGRPRTTEVIHEATDRIMAAHHRAVEDIRGEQAPAERFDPRKAGRARDRQPAQDGSGRSSR